MAASTKKTIDKSTLRKLMKEQKSKSSTSVQKIDSPLAKYNSIGQLSCKLCNVPVKAEKLWTAHISGRTHKEALRALKTSKSNPRGEVDNGTTQKKESQGQESPKHIPSKKAKNGTSGQLPDGFFDESVKAAQVTSINTVLAAAYSSDDSDDDDSLQRTRPTEPPSQKRAAVSKPSSSKKQQWILEKQKLQDQIPEGFFDSKEEEAKVLRKDYKDPQVEEWEKFQKEIAGATTVSEQIMDDDDEETKTRRQLGEIEEQMQAWNRVQELEKKQEFIKSKLSTTNRETNDMENSSGEEELDDLFDWKAKGVS